MEIKQRYIEVDEMETKWCLYLWSVIRPLLIIYWCWGELFSFPGLAIPRYLFAIVWKNIQLQNINSGRCTRIIQLVRAKLIQI